MVEASTTSGHEAVTTDQGAKFHGKTAKSSRLRSSTETWAISPSNLPAARNLVAYFSSRPN